MGIAEDIEQAATRIMENFGCGGPHGGGPPVTMTTRDHVIGICEDCGWWFDVPRTAEDGDTGLCPKPGCAAGVMVIGRAPRKEELGYNIGFTPCPGETQDSFDERVREYLLQHMPAPEHRGSGLWQPEPPNQVPFANYRQQAEAAMKMPLNLKGLLDDDATA